MDSDVFVVQFCFYKVKAQRKATCLCVYVVSCQKRRMLKCWGRLHRSFPPATFTLLLFSSFTPLFARSLLSWKTHATAISASLVCVSELGFVTLRLWKLQSSDVYYAFYTFLFSISGEIFPIQGGVQRHPYELFSICTRWSVFLDLFECSRGSRVDTAPGQYIW